MLLLFELGIALPDHSPVFVCAVPDLGAIGRTALPAVNLRGENRHTAVSPFGSPLLDHVLHPVKNLRLDDGLMTSLHIILGNLTVINNLFLGQEIRRVAFLKQGIPFVFLVL